MTCRAALLKESVERTLARENPILRRVLFVSDCPETVDEARRLTEESGADLGRFVFTLNSATARAIRLMRGLSRPGAPRIVQMVDSAAWTGRP